MLVSLKVNGVVVDTVDTNMVTGIPVRGYDKRTNTPITTDPALWGGYYDGGSYKYENAAAGQALVKWQMPNTSLTRTWNMDDNDALDLLLNTTIPNALNTSPQPAIIFVLQDGNEDAS